MGYEPLYFGKTKIEMLYGPPDNSAMSNPGSLSVKINHQNMDILLNNNLLVNHNRTDTDKKQIIYSPYIKNNDSLDRLLLTFEPDVLITKKIEYNYKSPENFEVYEISRQGMIKVVSKEGSIKITANNR